MHVIRFLTLRGRTLRLVMYGLPISVDVLVNAHSFLLVFPSIPKFPGKAAGITITQSITITMRYLYSAPYRIGQRR